MSDPNQPNDPNAGIPPQPGAVPPQQPYAQPAGGPQQPYAPSAAAAPLDAAQDKQWAAFAHLGGILWFLPSLIIWLVFKDRGRLTDQEAKEALNWQITWIIAWVASQVIGIIIGSFTYGVGYLLFGLLIPWALYIVNLVFSILGFVRVNGGGTYRYPVNFRFIK
ncbi:MAG: DUF4870 domain-containing protein [Leifsonia sp.]